MQNLGRGEGKQSVLLENSQLNIWGGVAITVVVWLGGGVLPHMGYVGRVWLSSSLL